MKFFKFIIFNLLILNSFNIFSADYFPDFPEFTLSDLDFQFSEDDHKMLDRGNELLKDIARETDEKIFKKMLKGKISEQLLSNPKAIRDYIKNYIQGNTTSEKINNVILEDDELALGMIINIHSDEITLEILNNALKLALEQEPDNKQIIGLLRNKINQLKQKQIIDADKKQQKESQHAPKKQTKKQNSNPSIEIEYQYQLIVVQKNFQEAQRIINESIIIADLFKKLIDNHYENVATLLIGSGNFFDLNTQRIKSMKDYKKLIKNLEKEAHKLLKQAEDLINDDEFKRFIVELNNPLFDYKYENYKFALEVKICDLHKELENFKKYFSTAFNDLDVPELA